MFPTSTAVGHIRQSADPATRMYLRFRAAGALGKVNPDRPEKGHAKTRILYNFGRADQVDREALERLVRSICRFLSTEEALRAQARLDGRWDVRITRSRSLGGVWFLDRLWYRLGLRNVLERLLKARRFQAPVERLVFALVANRALAPRSKLALEDWVAHEVAVPGLEEVAVQQLYRAMDFLLEAAEELQREVFFSVADLLSLEVDLIYFDTTSTYFEVELSSDEGEPLRRYGHSRDHRPDRPQAVIGLAVTRTGIPVRCWVWPGNTADMSVAWEVKRDLVGWKLGRVITVVERGMASEENLPVLQRTGGHYIAGGTWPPGNRRSRRRSHGRGATRRYGTSWRSRRSSSGTGRPESATSWSGTPSRPSGTGPVGNRTPRYWSRNWRASSTCRKVSTPRRCARCAVIRPGGGASSRTQKAGSRSTGPRSRPRSVWTASTCSGPRTTR